MLQEAEQQKTSLRRKLHASENFARAEYEAQISHAKFVHEETLSESLTRQKMLEFKANQRHEMHVAKLESELSRYRDSSNRIIAEAEQKFVSQERALCEDRESRLWLELADVRSVRARSARISIISVILLKSQEYHSSHSNTNARIPTLEHRYAQRQSMRNRHCVTYAIDMKCSHRYRRIETDPCRCVVVRILHNVLFDPPQRKRSTSQKASCWTI